MRFTYSLICCLSVCVLFSQEKEYDVSALEASRKQITFKDVTVENGLSQNSVVSIAQDSIGYLWFATQDGLNRYDGKTFKYYNKRFADVTRPSYSHLGKIYVDKQAGFWITTISGSLERYQPEIDAFITINKFDNVSSMYQNNKLDYYVGTYGNGLFKIDSETKDTIQLLKPQDVKREIYNVFSKNGSDFALASNGIIKIENDSYSVLNANTSEAINYSSAAHAANGNTWLGTFGKGLFVFDATTDSITAFSGFQGKNKLPSNLNIESLLVDKQNRLWVATYGNGVFLVDTENTSIRHFVAQKTNPFALHYNDVLCLFEDYTGTIWLGTDGAGLSYYDENLTKFNILTNNQTPKDINVDVIRAITVDNNNTIWLGTSGKGLTRYNSLEDGFKTYTTSNSKITSNRVMSLLNDDGNLWIGFQGNGLNMLDKYGRFKNFEALSGYTIWKIFKDTKDRIWLCTRDNGLIQFDNTKGVISRFNTGNSDIVSNNIRTVEESPDNRLWLGMDTGGLMRLNPENQKLVMIDAITDNVKSLYHDGDGTLWIGTNGSGLKAYHPETETVNTYSRNDGLPNNVVYSVLPDSQNNLWVSTNRGISKLTVLKSDRLEIVNYNNFDGLQALEFNTGAYFKDANGFLYFGGLEGLNWFKPNALTKNPIPPKTVINTLDVFSESQKLIPNTEFAHNQNSMTLGFAGLHYSLPERNNYKYKLDPYDSDWIDAKNTNTAYYPKLPPDDYTFQVTSSNYDNVWNEDPATYSFTIKQPWYFNTITKTLYALLLLISGIGVYRYLKWRWHIKMQLQLEHDETERLKKLDETKTRLYTNISHEFRTPLTLISGPIDKQLARSDLKTEDKKELKLVQRNAQRLLNLVNQMLDLSKLESGSLKLNVSQGNLSILLKQIAAAFKYKAEEKEITFSNHITDAEAVWFDKDIIEKVVTNLLANAIKYAPKKGTVFFETAIQDGQIIMTVINNGNTISDGELGKLFQRFYQFDKTADGLGVGLSLVKELAILSHGNIVAHTMNEDDIQFTVTLPIDRSYFNHSELVFEDTEFGFENTHESSKNSNDIAVNNSEEKPLLLVIEDDTDIRGYIVSIFQDMYTILEASHGKEGVERALECIPDLVISDVMMPIMDGIDVCNTLKHDEKTSHIPIILLTAKVGEENEIVGLKTGADDYITKPFSSDKLKIRAEKLIELRRRLQAVYTKEFEINPKLATKSSTDQQFFKRLQEVLDAHITDPDFNAEVFGDKMLMSRMQLHRKIKALTGVSTSMFLRSQRLKLARNLLKNSDDTVSEIAYTVGFNTPSYFIKCFKEAYNCTPNEYVEKM